MRLGLDLKPGTCRARLGGDLIRWTELAGKVWAQVGAGLSGTGIDLSGTGGLLTRSGGEKREKENIKSKLELEKEWGKMTPKQLERVQYIK